VVAAGEETGWIPVKMSEGRESSFCSNIRSCSSMRFSFESTSFRVESERTENLAGVGYVGRGIEWNGMGEGMGDGIAGFGVYEEVFCGIRV
jgi:hypothetical protein